MFDKKNFVFGFFSIVTLLALSRVIPHPPNFTPVIAVAIFSPYLFKDRIVSLSVPLGSMLLSDVLIGMHSSMIWVYFSVLVVCLLSYVFKKVTLGAKRFASLALVSSGLFFAITNFGVWLSGGLYPKSFEGLIICYTAGIPFFTNTVLSTFAFGFAIFGSLKLMGYWNHSKAAV